MPAPGEKDVGGNPLQEGIYADTDGGWKNRQVRDESYASTHTGGIQFPPCPNCGQMDGFEDYPFGHGMMWCKNMACQHLITPKDLGKQLNDMKSVHDAEIASLPETEGPPGHLGHAGAIARSTIATEELDYHRPEFEIEQVIEPGPHTVEVDAPGQPIVMQHEDPDILDAAKAQMIASIGVKESFWPLVGTLAARVAPSLIGSVLGKGVGNALFGGGGGGAQQPQFAAPPRGLQQLTHLVLADDLTHPSSQDRFPTEDSDDPEKVDNKEINDGSNDDWQKDPALDGTGGSQSPFSDKSHGVVLIVENLPHLQQFMDPNTSGEGDPIVDQIHQALEGEHPGYLDIDQGDVQDLIQQLFEAFQNGGEHPDGAEHEPAPVKDEAGDEGGDDDLDSNDIERESSFAGEGFLPGPVYPEEQLLQSDNWPEAEAQPCPHCGAVGKSQLGMCPHCMKEIHSHPQMMASQKTAAGPRTPEQFKAVADLLRSQGRDAEVVSLIDDPDQFGPELMQVQQRQEIPLSEDPAPPMPAQEQTPPGAGMPMPAPPTGEVPMVTSRWTILAEEDQQAGHAHENTFAVPAADQQGPENVENEQDSSMRWKDEGGAPLKVGQEYKLYSDKYDIPDIVRIEAVKPEAITFTITGEYGMSHTTELSHQEAVLNGNSFTPMTGQDTELAPPGDDLGYPEDADASPNSETDLSGGPDSHEFGMTAGFERGIVRRSAQPQVEENEPAHSNPALDWLIGGGDERTAGAKFTPVEQREFIDEDGMARNADKLDLTNTHYTESGADDDHFLW